MIQAIIFILRLTDKRTELGPEDAEKDETWVLPLRVCTVVRDSRHVYKKITIRGA